MLCIRLQRLGKPKQPVYRLIVSEKHRDTQYGSLEILGEYNPVRKEKLINFNIDRIKHWLSVGAQPSATVNNLLISQGIIEGKKQRSVTISKNRQTKLDAKKAHSASSGQAEPAVEAAA